MPQLSTPIITSVQTRLTKLLQCRYPIILPGMSWISTPPLVSAVSRAGGVGILATGPLKQHETRESIRKIREKLQQNDKSINNNPQNTTIPTFGIGATLLMPGATENVHVALEEQVPVINVSLGKPDWIAKQVHEYGGILISTVTNAKHAQAAIEAGADALLVTGHEAAAHGGDVTTMVLVASLSRQFPDIPIISAGGIGNGQGLAAVLCLGADGVAMGTRLAVTQESPLALTAKQAIVQSNESQTVYGSNFDGIPARVLSTPMAQKLMSKRPNFIQVAWRALQASHDMKIPLWKVLPGLLTQWNKMYMVAQFGAASQRLTKATIDGDLDEGVQFVGQSLGVVNDIPHVEELLDRIVMEAHETLSRRKDCFEIQEDEEEVFRAQR